jgi:hypothetical protein
VANKKKSDSAGQSSGAAFPETRAPVFSRAELMV